MFLSFFRKISSAIASVFCDGQNLPYQVDEFYKYFEKEPKKYMVSDGLGKPFKSKMNLSEIMKIIIYWHQSGYKNFKSFYTK